MCRGLSLHYGKQLELSTYQHNTADYIYMYLVGMMSMNVRFFSPPSVFLPCSVRAFISSLQHTPVLLTIMGSGARSITRCFESERNCSICIIPNMDCRS